MKKRWIILLLLLLLFFGIILFLFIFYNNGSEVNGKLKDPDYSLNQNGDIVIDKANNLMWQRSSGQERTNWNDSIAYCNSLNLEEFEDWRLPNLEELELVYDSAKNNSFWTNELEIHGFWSATTVPDYPDLAYGFRIVDGKGKVLERGKTDSYYFVALCVHSQ
jgi:hypothetical protein